MRISDSELKKVQAGQIVSTLTKLGGSVTELVAYGAFRASPDFVWKILDDVENYPTNMPRVKSATVLRRHATGLRMELVVDTPFPLPDISSIYESVHVVENNNWKREWKQVTKGLAPNSGSWHLVSMPDRADVCKTGGTGGTGGTLAEYRVRVAPIIPIPKRLIEFGHKRVVPEVFRMVGESASRLQEQE